MKQSLIGPDAASDTAIKNPATDSIISKDRRSDNTDITPDTTYYDPTYKEPKRDPKIDKTYRDRDIEEGRPTKYVPPRDSGTESRLSMSTARRSPGPYYFNGYMPEEVMHRYLDKAITMQGYSNEYVEPPGTSFGPTDLQREQDWEMIKDIRPKFIGRIAYFWGLIGQGEVDAIIDRLTEDIRKIQDFDSDIICQAFITESVDDYSKDIQIPAHYYDLFHRKGYPIQGPFPRTFDYKKMLFAEEFRIDPVNFDKEPGAFNKPETSEPDIDNSPAKGDTPDIANTETMMWYYFLATMYIDCGIEALHMGTNQFWRDRQWGMKHTNYLLGLIRNYAKTHARNGVVLIDGHNPYENTWYYTPGITSKLGKHWSLAPFLDRHLLYDFSSLGVYYTRTIPPPDPELLKIDPNYKVPGCDDPNNMPARIIYGSGLLNSSPGGINPQGWLCTHNPVLMELDHGSGCELDFGCEHNSSFGVLGDGLDLYNCDNISWFMYQGDSKTIWKNPIDAPFDFKKRNRILAYTYYISKCLDPFAHFQFPGRRTGTNLKSDFIPKIGRTIYLYRANTYKPGLGGFNQQETIKKIWNGGIDTYFNWTFHNFTNESVAPYKIAPNLLKVKSGLVMVGSEKMYFIGADGFIYGYIRHSNGYNQGCWVSWCLNTELALPPGARARRRFSFVDKGATNIAASPDGSKIVYIGEDDRIHGFNVYSGFSYNHFTLPNDPDILPLGDLVFAENDLIFYIGLNRSRGLKAEIHGLQTSRPFLWETISPTYAAVGTGARDQQLDRQAQPAGSLTYSKANSRLYYRGVDGYFYYFKILSKFDYRFHNPVSANNQLIRQKLAILGNFALHKNRVYFIARYLPTGYNDNWVHCLYEADAGSDNWNTLSPSYSGDISRQSASLPQGNISVSPDGNTIAYFGDGFVCLCINKGDDLNYKFIRPTYNAFLSDGPNNNPVVGTGNSLQFRSNTHLIYINENDAKVHELIYETAYGINTVLSNYPY